MRNSFEKHEQPALERIVARANRVKGKRRAAQANCGSALWNQRAMDLERLIALPPDRMSLSHHGH
jgi:hypothetical protein